MDKAGKRFIPDDDEELQLRIYAAAQCGLGDHREMTATAKVIKDKLPWTSMDADIKNVCSELPRMNSVCEWLQGSSPTRSADSRHSCL